MSDTRLQHIGSLLDSKNRTVRAEAIHAFGKYSIADEKVSQILFKHITSPSWEARVSAGDALRSVLRNLELKTSDGDPTLASGLQVLDISYILNTFKPLLSENEAELAVNAKLSTKQQRRIIDQHLELIDATGLSSSRFLPDAEVLPRKFEAEPVQKEIASLTDFATELKQEADENGNASDGGETDDMQTLLRERFERFVKELFPVLGDHRWQLRHGAAIALSRIVSSCYPNLPARIVDAAIQLLLEVLVLDQFNDFMSGRNATAPVRETCAQAIGHILNVTDESRRKLILAFMFRMLEFKGDKNWNVRQSALLVLKYYFAVAKLEAQIFDNCFDVVVRSLDDPIDDVVCCAVMTLSSILANRAYSVGREEGTKNGVSKENLLVDRVLQHVWRLLEIESKKEQLRSGLDALCVDLMGIVETWLRLDAAAYLDRRQTMIVSSMLDAAFPTRSAKVVALIDTALDRGHAVLQAKEAFSILKQFYRALLFAAPGEDTVFIEMVFLAALKLLRVYHTPLVEEDELSSHIGRWMCCILYDHRNPLINVFELGTDGSSSSPKTPQERMCSEEMRFLSEKEKDNVYVTRKILCAKLLAAILEIVYEAKKELDGQPVSKSVQLLFAPYLQSSSLMHNLGAALIVNEWAALYRAALNKGTQPDAPMTVISLCDALLRGPPKSFDELTTSVHLLTNECNEFVDYCSVRGFNRKAFSLDQTSSAEVMSSTAYEECRAKAKSQNQLDSLDSRYKSLCEFIKFTKSTVRINTTRVYALISSALFYFGCAPDKLTPQIRPLVEAMQNEDNEAVAAEIFRGSIPLLLIYSSTRQPKPFVKVLAKAMESFSSCPFRIPKPGLQDSSLIVTMERIGRSDAGETNEEISAESKNAELILVICSNFSISQVPEYYSHFDLDETEDMMTLLSRLELHGCLWSRVVSSLSESSSATVLKLLASPDPNVRFAGAKAVETFARSRLGDTISLVLHRLTEMSANIDSENDRRGAAEAVLRLAMMENSVAGVATLLCPLAFCMLTDQLAEIRDAAGEAFRRLVPLVVVEDPSYQVVGLSEELNRKRIELADFIHVLASPARLPHVSKQQIVGLAEDVELRHYQIEGITWMRFLKKYSLNGILADDMGLGKTLQTMCALALSVDYDGIPQNSRCSLIVCPRTLVDHWCAEWKRFFPVRPPARKSAVRNLETEIIVVAYEDLKTNQYLQKKTWNYVVLDEGHVMRNPKTVVWKVAMELKAKSRLLLSGTPIQNSPTDVWALFTWLMPGYLGNERQFRAKFLKKILKCRSNKASEADIKNGSAAVDQLHRLILPFVLRRLKSEVLKELPDKNVQDYECELSEEQKEIYRFLVDRCTTSEEALRSGNGIAPLHALIALRKLVDHPTLILNTLDKLNAPQRIRDLAKDGCSSGKLDALGQLLTECGICQSEEEAKNEDVDDAILPSETLEQSHRALIFCQWKTSAALVSKALETGVFGNKVSHLVLDGDTPPSERLNVVNRFNTDVSIDVLVLTTHIGGVGLNLTGADVVIFLDHDWNPMKDLQAIDRAHRLGQTKKVNVYRLITQGTVEQKVMSLHKFKINTAQALIGADNTSLRSMQTTELMEMFSLDGDDSKSNSSAAPVPKKRAKKGQPEDEWNLAEMWDETQYDVFDVQNFLRQTSSS